MTNQVNSIFDGASDHRPARKGSRLTLAGGILATVGGTFHLAVAAAMRRDVWSQVAADGLRDAITLEPSPDEMALAEAFWFSPGSFGFPLLLLGLLTIRLNRRGEVVPVWVGGGLGSWSLVVGYISGFDVGSCALTTIGALLTAGSLTDRQRTRA